MKISKTSIDRLYIVDLDFKNDDRGFFARTFCSREFESAGLNPYMVQSNMSFSIFAGTLRGMHYQDGDFAEDKLVRCVSGKIFDVAVDLRKESKTRYQWFGLELSDCNHKSLYVPKGFAHGFLTLEENSMVHYQVSNYYNHESEKGIRWDDPIIKIEWPIEPKVISERDLRHLFL